MPTPEAAPQFIYLEPNCGHQTDERLWCADNVWGDKCEECGAPVYRYRLDGKADSSNSPTRKNGTNQAKKP